MTMLTRLKQVWQSKRGLLLSAVIGLVVGAVLLSLTIKLWWVVAVILLLGMVAVWQVPRVRGCLPGQPSADATDHPVRYWGWRMAVALVLIVAVLIGQAVVWLANKHYPEKLSELDLTVKPPFSVISLDQKWQQLRWDYVWQKVFWDLGFKPLPDLVTIPAGSFERGEGEFKHVVDVAASFMMSATEVTFAEYDYYVWRMQEMGADPDDLRYPHDEVWGRGTRPVINVNWYDAQGYAHWLSKQIDSDCRLPSEAEWEYAARAGTTTNYFWGDDIGKNNANCDGCGSQWDNKQTAPVASFKANDWGLHDMHGNVYEWTQDRYGNYQDAPTDGSAWEGGDGTSRVVRGGSWYAVPDDLRSSIRSGNRPGDRYDDSGFRVVCSPPSTDS